MAIKPLKIELKFKDCSSAFEYSKPKFFSFGGGGYEELGFPGLWNLVKHIYFFKWCILSFYFMHDEQRILIPRGGNKHFKKLLIKAEKKEIHEFLKKVEKSNDHSED